jgi:hypothetical protein
VLLDYERPRMPCGMSSGSPKRGCRKQNCRWAASERRRISGSISRWGAIWNTGKFYRSLFQRQWQIYRKVVDNNYLFHREAYKRLHNLLIDEIAEPFCFLDVACGDASATVEALKGTQVDLITASMFRDPRWISRKKPFACSAVRSNSMRTTLCWR